MPPVPIQLCLVHHCSAVFTPHEVLVCLQAEELAAPLAVQSRSVFFVTRANGYNECVRNPPFAFLAEPHQKSLDTNTNRRVITIMNVIMLLHLIGKWFVEIKWVGKPIN
jgi:hypothetical protein